MVLPSYELVQDKSFSDPGATKIIWDIVVPKTVTKLSLTALLNSLYEKEKAEHSDAVTISFYAYVDKDHEEEGRWLAWLMTNDGLEKAPTIKYDDVQINGLSKKPVMVFGKSEEDRKQIYKEYNQLGEDYPGNVDAQERGLNRMTKTLHLTRKQLDAIFDEGQKKIW